jgi:Family of unknown function (DUF6299)
MRVRRGVLVVTLVVAVGLAISATAALGFVSGLTANSNATLSVSGTVATVSGTVQCFNEDGDIEVDARLRQPRGRTFTEGFGDTVAVCDGTVQSWTMLITTPQGATWKTGKATLGAFAEDIDGFREVQTTVRLNRG